MSYSENDPFSQQSVFVNFNQDFTSLAVGTRAGYRFFALNNVDRLEQIHHSGEQEDIALIERLFNSSLVAFVSLPSSRKLKVCHFKRGKEITNFSYSNTILAVKLNRSRVVVCLEESLYIHNIQDMRVLHTIRDTPANPKGVCALSTASDRGVTYLAYPGSTSMGEIQIFDTENLCAKIMIPAHNSPLAALAFNANGSVLASASEKGTVIRVFSVTDGTRIYELRRGLKRCATIYSLAFNAESTLLACASNTETVHIFRLDENSASSGASAQPTVGSFQEEPGWMNMFGKALMSGSSYLPFAVSDVFAQGRSFATAKLTFSGIPSVVALSTIDRQCRLLVASTNGFLYVYNVNVEQGGECSFWRQHNLVEDVPGSGTTVGATTTPGSGGGTFGCVSPRRGMSYAVVTEGSNTRSVSLEDQIQEASNASPHSPSSPTSLRLQDDTEFPPMSHGVD